MSKPILRRTHCRVPGHGTGCIAVWENHSYGLSTNPRTTEERLALDFELAADSGIEKQRRLHQQ